MYSAVYGRMHVGGCVKRNLGYVGCAIDVLEYMDAKCSGRTHCNVQIMSLTLLEQPCPEDVTSYLEASFICQPGKLRH